MSQLNLLDRLKIDRKLLSIKLVLFFYYAATMSFFSYFGLYYKNLGLSVEDSSLLSTILPITNIPANLLTGILADKIGSYKPIFIASLIFGTAFYDLMLFVPPVHKSTPTSSFRIVNETTFIPYCNSPIETLKYQNLTDAPITCQITCNTLNSSMVNVTYDNLTSSYKTEISFGISDECYVNNCEGAVCILEGWTHGYVFGSTFAIVVAGTLFLSIGFMLTESILFAMLKNHSGLYGRNKMFGMVGRIVSPPITGIIIDYVNAKLGYVSYSPCFIIMTILMIATTICSFYLDVKPEKPQKNVLGILIPLLLRGEVIFYLIVTFILGGIWGFVVIFLMWHLNDMNASNLNIGLLGSVSSLVSLPFFFAAEKIIDKIGQTNIVLIGFLAYGARCMAYAYITNPWWAILVETLGELLCIHILWVAIANYANDLGGTKLRASMQGMLRMTHYYLGRSLGVLVAGMMIERIGMRQTFWWFSVVSFGSGIAYYVTQILVINRLEKRRKERESKAQYDEVPQENELATETGEKKNVENDDGEEKLQRERSNSVHLAP